MKRGSVERLTTLWIAQLLFLCPVPPPIYSMSSQWCSSPPPSAHELPAFSCFPPSPFHSWLLTLYLSCIYKELSDVNMYLSKYSNNVTYFLTFTNQITLPIQINGRPITTTDSFKFLGTHISNNLKWKTNTEHIIAKVQQRLYLLRLKRNGSSNNLLFCSTQPSLSPSSHTLLQ